MLKKVVVLLLLLGLAFALMLLTTGGSRFVVRSSRVLPAPPQQVWQHLAAVPDWPRWWPGLTRVRLDDGLSAGSMLQLQLRGQPRVTRARLSVVGAPDELGWESPGVFGSHAGTRFLLEAQAAGCRLTVENYIHGPQAFLARFTGREAFSRYQRKLLENLALELQRSLAAGGEKD